MTFKVVEIASQSGFFGSMGGLWFNTYINSSLNYAFSYQDSSNNSVNTGVAVDDSIHTIDFDGKNKTYKIDDTSLSLSSYTATLDATYNTTIFSYNNQGNVSSMSKLRLYSMQIYDNGTLVRDFIPIMDNGIPCLFDRVSGQNYYNQGRGEFLCEDMEMITDRTQTDVDNVDIDSSSVQKGAYNYTDLQRVEYKVRVLNELLKNEDYMSEILTTKIDWDITDKFNATNGTRYLNNVKKIRQALAVLPSTPAVPSTMNKLNYVRANNIEKILVDIENLIYSMYNYYVYSGVSRSGQRRLYQNRFRHLYKYNEYNFEILSTESGGSLITENGELLEVAL